MKRSQSIAMAGMATSLLLASSAAPALTQLRERYPMPANICTLSVPTTDSKVRPRATGFRNEGATNAFVICAFDPEDQYPDNGGTVSVTPITGDPIYISLYAKSIDGQDHYSISCTAVNSWLDIDEQGAHAPMQYITKNLSAPVSGNGWLYFSGSDFGAGSGIPTSGGPISITCLLPPGTSIVGSQIWSMADVGS